MINKNSSSQWVESQSTATSRRYAPCVSGDTEILTERGYFSIRSLVDQEVSVWNGKEFSTVIPSVTGENQDILKVTLSDNKEIKCTFSHQWILSDNSRIEAKDLKIGSVLTKVSFPVIEFGQDYAQDDIISGVGNPRVDYSIASRLQWLANIFEKHHELNFLVDGDEQKSKIVRVQCIDNKDLMDIVLVLNTLGVGDYSIFNQHDVANLRLPLKSIRKLIALGIPFDFEPLPTNDFLDGLLEKATVVVGLKVIGKMDKVYCFTERQQHAGIFSGILLGNCGQ